MNFLVFPTQLFSGVRHLKGYKKVYLIEEPQYMTRFEFHKLKLAYHRASMKAYQEYLEKNNIKVAYVEFPKVNTAFYRTIGPAQVYDPVDHDVEAKLKRYVSGLEILATPAFLNTKETLSDFINDYFGDDPGDKRWRHDQFYKWQRKHFDILMTSAGKPQGGKWSYDSKNREAFPKNIEEPVVYRETRSPHVDEAIKYVKRHFKDNPGELSHFIYPITHGSAQAHFKLFLEKKFKLFGRYQDAFASDIDFGYHSVISCCLNSGLLEPDYVLKKTLEYAGSVPMNSLEGFIRQLFWREYIRMLYVYEYSRLKNSNYFGHRRRLHKDWWEGTTGMLPVDVIIRKVQKYAYAHHIERLMVLGNLMLLCEVHPKEVFKWFISFVSIDAYDWVMWGNVCGMSQWSTGALMLTRPYFSSSNYILKMSDYKKGEGEETIKGYSWDEVWDALYYNFVRNNRDPLKKNYATANAVRLWDKKKDSEKREIKQIARAFIRKVSK